MKIPCWDMAVIKINKPSNWKSWLKRFVCKINEEWWWWWCWFCDNCKLGSCCWRRQRRWRHFEMLVVSLLRDLAIDMHDFSTFLMTFGCRWFSTDLWLWLIIIPFLYPAYCFIFFIIFLFVSCRALMQLLPAAVKWFAFNFDDLLMIKFSLYFVTSMISKMFVCV